MSLRSCYVGTPHTPSACQGLHELRQDNLGGSLRGCIFVLPCPCLRGSCHWKVAVVFFWGCCPCVVLFGLVLVLVVLALAFGVLLVWRWLVEKYIKIITLHNNNNDKKRTSF